MKTTKQQLRQIIKEELEVILTNEEAGELFGEGVEAELEEESLDEGLETFLSHMNPEDLGLLIKVLGQVAYNFSPAAFGTVAYMAARRIAGLDSEFEKRQEIERAAEEYAAGNQQMKEQQGMTSDVARVGKKLDSVQGLEALLASINNRDKFEAVLTQFIQMVAKERLQPNDVKMGVRNVAAAILKGK